MFDLTDPDEGDKGMNTIAEDLQEYRKRYSEACSVIKDLTRSLQTETTNRRAAEAALEYLSSAVRQFQDGNIWQRLRKAIKGKI